MPYDFQSDKHLSEETRIRIRLELLLAKYDTIVFGATQKHEFTTTECVNVFNVPALIDKVLVIECSDGILRDTGAITLNNTTGDITIAGDVYEGVSVVLLYR